MSKRIDIKGKIINDILVLKFHENKKTHAIWKCLCMSCNELTYKSYTNLISGNSKSCQKCGQKISNGKEQDIYWDLKTDMNISEIAKKYAIDRRTVKRVRDKYCI